MLARLRIVEMLSTEHLKFLLLQAAASKQVESPAELSVHSLLWFHRCSSNSLGVAHRISGRLDIKTNINSAGSICNLNDDVQRGTESEAVKTSSNVGLCVVRFPFVSLAIAAFLNQRGLSLAVTRVSTKKGPV